MATNSMDRELGSGYRRRRLGRRVGVAAGLVALGAAVFVLLPGWLRPSLDRDRLRIGFVDRGPVEGTIEASGTVVAAFEKVLSSPVEARVERVLVRPGATVARGHEILRLDTSASRLELDLDILRDQREAVRRELELAGTRAGSEVDFVVYGQDVFTAVEVKHAGDVRPHRPPRPPVLPRRLPGSPASPAQPRHRDPGERRDSLPFLRGLPRPQAGGAAAVAPRSRCSRATFPELTIRF